MTRDVSQRRPRLALPYTILTGPDTVRLVAGEDFRYTLSGPGVEGWLADFLSRLHGTERLEAAVARLPDEHRTLALQLTARLYGERVLVDGPAAAAHSARACRLAVEGSGALCDELAKDWGEGVALPVLCQDRLDYEEALRFSRRCRGAHS